MLIDLIHACTAAYAGLGYALLWCAGTLSYYLAPILLLLGLFWGKAADPIRPAPPRE